MDLLRLDVHVHGVIREIRSSRFMHTSWCCRPGRQLLPKLLMSSFSKEDIMVVPTNPFKLWHQPDDALIRKRRVDSVGAGPHHRQITYIATGNDTMLTLRT